MTRSTVNKAVMKPRRRAKLPEAPRMDNKHKKTLIVVADSARARFFEPGNGKLVAASRSEMVSAMARKPSGQIVTDKPGRSFRSPTRGFNRHALEPAHDPQKVEKHKFTAQLAEALDAAVGRYDKLILVAPRRSLGELRTLISKRVQQSLAHEVPKDLTTSTPQAVWKTLTATLPLPI
jgi:protein required for attachment to host cells